ncbi:3-phosphoglycerate dehydrogenase [Tepiditoga spiralis]|uniref:3-phosphoglycerate dehydrogenase n=1 Tax=Tepiditoga spiralis TaxID=2108365 RepID=A0A7G1G5J4_9BACT|nr:2-hydroxyacid dehydrogenase [Tepiditoga spiralis]BBE31848.1 3-phosphoglycerate dehydrogenase [Tepiditoga spiralis]
MIFLFRHILNDYWKTKINYLENKYKLKIITDENVDISKVDALIGGTISKEELKKAKNLKIIFVPYSGVNILPSNEIIEKKIIVANAKGNGKIVAERAIALALSLLGRIPEFHNDLSRGIWHGFTIGEKPNTSWTSIREKKCGILGTGSIGGYIAKYLKPFECKTIGFKKNINNKVENFDELSNDINYVVNKSDIIFVALPLTEKTRNLISEDILYKMKGKYLINVGRGPIVNEKALYESIKNNILAGAAIDVWYDYPNKENKYKIPSKYPIHTFKNVIVSPHVAGFNEESVRYSIDWTIENIESYINTGKPKNIVDMKEKY